MIKTVAKRALRRAMFTTVRASGVPFLLRNVVQRGKVTILCFHDMTAEHADFAFAWIARRYQVIALSDYLSARRRGTLDQLPKKSVVITFDDGHKNNYALGEVIRRHKLPVTVFLTSGVVGTHRHFWFMHPLSTDQKEAAKRLSNEERLALLKDAGFTQTAEHTDRQALLDHEVRELAELVDFQSHTMFHPCLPRCSDEEARAEIAGARLELESRFERPIYAIAYPNGEASPRDRAITAESGYECGLTTDPGYVDGATDLFALPRFVVEDDAKASELEVTVSGAWGYLRPALKRLLRAEG